MGVTLTVEHGRRQGCLFASETSLQSIIRNGEDHDDITDDTKESPADEEPVLRLEEEVLVKGNMLGSNGLVAILHDQTDTAVHNEADDGQDSERPLQPEVRNHGICSQGIGEATESGAACCQSVGERSPLGEPLWDNADGSCEAETQTEAEADALAQEKLPRMIREGGGDE